MSAADRERIEAITQRLIDGGCEHEVELCREQCDTFAEYCLPCQADWLLSQLSALSEALNAANEEIARLKATTT